MSTGPAEVLVLRERHDAVELLTIHRPKAMNALNSGVMASLSGILDDLASDDAIRAVVITGSGKAFVAGADIAQMRDFGPAQAEEFATAGHALGAHIAALQVPVIAAVNGFALGGGCELAMACDIVLAGEKARFGQPEVKLGVIPGFGGTQRLTRRVGVGRALDLCLTGRMVGAEEAVAMGLADRLVEGDVVQEALKAAEQIAANGPVAVRLAKRAILENADADLSTALAAEKSLFALCFSTDDQSEGMAAFLDKRPAEFTGE